VSAKYSNKMIVIGGGVIGVATLAALCSKGVPAVLLEAGDDLALETSFANGGMMSASQPEPWNGSGALGHLLTSLFHPSSAMKMHWSVLPELTGWGLKFLANSFGAVAQRSAESNFKLARYSAECTAQLVQAHNLQFDHANNGSLKVFSSKLEFEKSRKMAERLQEFGLSFELLDHAGAIAVEPALCCTQDHIAGAIYYPDDGIGDVRKFTLELAKQAVKAGGEIKLCSKVTGLIVEAGQVVGIKSNTKKMFGDVIVCAGTSASSLLASIGIKLPVQPVKGYSITLKAANLLEEMPKMPVINEAKHIAISPIGDRLRVVGTAEFAGYDHSLPPERLQLLTTTFNKIYPHLSNKLDWQKALSWAGLRPMSADGIPILGKSPMDGLWLNCGHGHLGWTMAAGSAQLLVDIITGTAPAIEIAAYGFDRC